MFELASRAKLRFQHNGILTVEDLWDLHVETLDAMYGRLCAEREEQSGASLLKQKTTQSEQLDLGISILKHIVETKVREAQERVDVANTKIHMRKIASIIDRKKDAELEGKSVEELQKIMEDAGGRS